MGNRINYDYIDEYIDDLTAAGDMFVSSPQRAFLSEIHHDAAVELESIKRIMHLTSKEIMERYLLR